MFIKKKEMSRKMKDKIELVRNILYNASEMNAKEETLLKLSQKFDQYIVKFLQESLHQKGDKDERQQDDRKDL